jgi:hypothetical protein
MFRGGRASVVRLERDLSRTPRAVVRSDDRLDRGALRGHGLPTRTYVYGDQVERDSPPLAETAPNRR